jgi:hypothetical protein
VIETELSHQLLLLLQAPRLPYVGGGLRGIEHLRGAELLLVGIQSVL